jgi:ankyrin repeat protein
MNINIINHLSVSNKSALSYACISGLEEVALNLIPFTYNHILDQVDSNGYTALNYAIENNLTKVIQNIKLIRQDNEALSKLFES